MHNHVRKLSEIVALELKACLHVEDVPIMYYL